MIVMLYLNKTYKDKKVLMNLKKFKGEMINQLILFQKIYKI